MIVVDVETTGLSPWKHSIVSIGALDFFHPGNQFYAECRMREGAEIQEQALEVNGFTKEQITDPNKPSLQDVMKQFCDWAEKIGYKTIAGENPFFDRDFLNDSARRYQIDFRIASRIIDLHSVSYAYHLKKGFTVPIRDGKSDLNLDKTLVLVGLPKEPRPHNALMGAKMEAEAFSRLIYGKILLVEFRQYPLPSHVVKG